MSSLSRLNWNKKNRVKINKTQRLYKIKYSEKYSRQKQEMNDTRRKRGSLKCVCNILKEHAEKLKDDPERLKTDFLVNLIFAMKKR